MIEIDERRVEAAADMLRGVPGGVGRALAGAMNRALSAYAAESSSGIRKTYRIKARDLKDRSRTSIKKASASRLEGGVRYAGHVIPLIRFKASPGRPVSAAVLKETGAKRLKDAYFANLGSGLGVFERETRQRASSRQLFGPSAAQMAANDDVMEAAAEKARATLYSRLDHEVHRILAGYGGRRGR